MATLSRCTNDSLSDGLGNMLEAEDLYRDLLDFHNEALVVISDSGTILLAPQKTREWLQQGEMRLGLRELSDSALVAKYNAGTERRQAFLLDANWDDDLDKWAPLLWSQLKAGGVDGILVLYDN